MTSELTLLAFVEQFNQYVNQKHVLCDCIVELEYNNHLVLPLIETEMHNFKKNIEFSYHTCLIIRLNMAILIN